MRIGTSCSKKITWHLLKRCKKQHSQRWSMCEALNSRRLRKRSEWRRCWANATSGSLRRRCSSIDSLSITRTSSASTFFHPWVITPKVLIRVITGWIPTSANKTITEARQMCTSLNLRITYSSRRASSHLFKIDLINNSSFSNLSILFVQLLDREQNIEIH